MAIGSEHIAPIPASQSGGDSRRTTLSASLVKSLELASSLSPEDRLRLISGVWASLPPWHSAAPTSTQLSDLQREFEEYDAGRTDKFGWDIVLRLIAAGCPNEPPKIYSAPRRFDLSTIFVVTLAYSLLFGAMAGLSFPPAVSVIVGAFVLCVGAGQALLFGGKRPRTASLIVGTLIYSLAMVAVWLVNSPRMYPASAVLVMGTYVMIGGGILGYLSGVMIGGVFLVADKLRKRFSHRSRQEESTGSANTLARGDSPWAN